MKLEIEIKGLKELRRKLRDVRRKAEALESEQTIPLAELFPADFLRQYTEFDSLEDMFQTSDFVVESPEDFKKIPEDQWDQFISSRTRFSSWKEMLNAATAEWTKRKLGF